MNSPELVSAVTAACAPAKARSRTNYLAETEASVDELTWGFPLKRTESAPGEANLTM